MSRYSLLFTFVWVLSVVGVVRADVYDNMKQIDKTLFWIENYYVDTVNTDHLTEVAIKAMLKELDPHSTYLSAEEVKAMNENLGAGFEGIGIVYRMDTDTLFVIGVTPDGPSAKAGILPGDRIIMVGDSCIAGHKLDTKGVQGLLRGPKGTQVKLGISRPNKSKKLLWYNVRRDRVPIYSVECSYMMTPTVGYIYVSRFASSTPEEVASAIQMLQNSGMQDLIIDLQNNGGGYLQAAVSMAEQFLPTNVPVVYTDGRADQRHYYNTGNSFFKHTFKGRVVVLINEQTASAAEILSGCLQDLDRAVVVGRRSFGKGLVQRPVELEGGAMLRLTVSHYYTPSGRCIQKPYSKGDKKSYDEDIINRLHNGELVSADSIHFADSLRFTTSGGRVVYGGGGIMPDVFVPLDTLRMSPLHRQIQARGTLLRYVSKYYRQEVYSLHQTYNSINAFIQGFSVTDEMMDDLFQTAKADSLPLLNTDSVGTAQLDSLYQDHMQNALLRLQVKAYIASDMFRNGAYTQIINSDSEFCRVALDILADKQRYGAILNKE